MKTTPRTMQPSDFQVNQTWLAFKITKAPLQVEGQAVDLYVLQDAGSMFLFGHALAPHGEDYPPIGEAKRLMASAYAKRNEWPSELVLPGRRAPDNSFAKVAAQNGVAQRFVPESQMSLYIKDTQESYEEFLGRGESDA